MILVNLLYITIDGCLLLACWAWIYLFLQNSADPDQPAPYLIRTQTVFISACKYMALNKHLKFGRNIVYMYMIIQTIMSLEMHHSFMQVQTPTTIYGFGRNVHLWHFPWPKCPWPKCPGGNVLGWNVRGRNVLHSWGQLAGKTMTVFPP